MNTVVTVWPTLLKTPFHLAFIASTMLADGTALTVPVEVLLPPPPVVDGTAAPAFLAIFVVGFEVGRSCGFGCRE